MFSQASVCPRDVGAGRGGIPVPGPFPGLWSQVPCRVEEGGTPVPGSFPSLWSQVLCWVEEGGTPVPGSLSGLWSQVISREGKGNGGREGVPQRG